MSRASVTSLAAVAVVVASACSSGTPSAHPPSTTAPVTVTTTPKPGSPFCDFLRSYTAHFSSLSQANGPQQLQISLPAAETAIANSVSVAPPELRPDITVLDQDLKLFIKQLRLVNFDITKLQPADLQPLSAPQFVTAGQHLTDYIQQNCP